MYTKYTHCLLHAQTEYALYHFKASAFKIEVYKIKK